MPGVGPITNTRTLKSALDETIDKFSSLPDTRLNKKLLGRCRSYRTLVESWDSVSPPPDEQFETIGQIMQLLGEAMNVIKTAETEQRKAKARAKASMEEPIVTLGSDLDELTDVSPHEDLPGGFPRSHVLELYLEPWTFVGAGVAVKVIRNHADGAGGLAMVRLKASAELAGQHHGIQEHIFVLEGCVRHAGVIAHAGSCIRIDAASDSSPVQALGEATLLLIDTERECIAAG